jgi:ketosteroid isomerase-like protein
MSAENVAIAKRINALALRGEIDAILSLVADDVVATTSRVPSTKPGSLTAAKAALAHWARTHRNARRLAS